MPYCKEKMEKWRKEWTAVSVKKTTRDVLKEFGKKGDTYEDIVIKLVIFWNENHMRNEDGVQ